MYLKQDMPAVMVSPMEIPREEKALFYEKTCAFVCQTIALPAAMVLEETASHKPQS